jgi:hypothetical protein
MGRGNLASKNIQRRERDNLEGSAGYRSSGEGEWSVRHASPGGAEPSHKRDYQEFTRLDWQIQKEVSELHRHQRRAQETTDPLEITKHLERAGKVKRFLDRLRAEQRRGV